MLNHKYSKISTYWEKILSTYSQEYNKLGHFTHSLNNNLIVLDNTSTTKWFLFYYIKRAKSEVKSLCSEYQGTTLIILISFIISILVVWFWKESATKFSILVMSRKIAFTINSKMTQTGEHNIYTLNTNIHI